MTVVVVIILLVLMIRNNSKMLRVSISIIIAGALGNWIDRVLYGKVTDFFDFYPLGYDYPVFNVADICVNMGTILLLFYIIFIYKDPSPSKNHSKEEKTALQSGDS